MIGILALQGDFDAHARSLARLDMPTRLVKLPRHLEGLKGLILPGGESSTMLKLLDAFELFAPVKPFGDAGAPILGTCAGAILMCRDNNKNQKSFGWLPASIDRNAYGSQRDSFHTQLACPEWDLDALSVSFIRAPRITAVDEEVTVLSRYEDDITGIAWRNFVAVTFHTELEHSQFHGAWIKRYVSSEVPVS